LRIVERKNGASTDLSSAPIPDDAPRPYLLEVTSYDDRLRAQIGQIVVEPPDRGDVRSGRLALVARGRGACHGLTVTALDAWRCHFHSSRYDDFVAHIDSFGGVVGILEEGVVAAPTSNVAALLAATSDRIEAAMSALADSEARERLFGEWIEALALPLREAPEALELTRSVAANSAQLLLIESPEPLRFSRDVTLQVRRRKKSQHWPPPRPPLQDIAVFLADLEEDGDAMIVPHVPSGLRTLRQIVRVEETREGRVYHVYSLPARTRPGVTKVARQTIAGSSAPRHFETIADNEIGFFDAGGRPLHPPILSPSPQFYVDVPVRILSNGDERRALVIPTGALPAVHAPMSAGTYRLLFEIDRRRWRSATPDNTTNYRAAHLLALSW
jgi:hypothetical protein